jgi:peptidoglycan/LPS O-acetylase OafA/YrhL
MVKRLPFVPQLDSFRFFAVSLVIIAHWASDSAINKIPNGFLGVTFFYVLSSFLISTNLLHIKKGINKNELTIRQALGAFFYKRSLRIFPLYFLVLILLTIAVKDVFKGHVGWYFTYTQNFLIYKTQSWPGMLSHFWSLGVEEQFYIVWPLIILFLPWTWFKFVIPGITILSILCKFFFYLNSTTFFTYYDALPISCFDAFGIGAAFALMAYEKSTYTVINPRFFPWLLTGALALSVILFLAKLSFLFGLSVAIFSVLLIQKACEGMSGLIGKILNSPVLLYLGKISYGLYVYHNFMPWLLRCFSGRETSYPLPISFISFDHLKHPYVAFLIEFVMLIALASISWYVFEKPINSLKKYSKV